MWMYVSDWLLSNVNAVSLVQQKGLGPKKKRRKERECCVDLFILIFRERRGGGKYDQIEEKKKIHNYSLV